MADISSIKLPSGNTYDIKDATARADLENKVNEPSIEGANGQVLATDGNGGRSWTTVSVPSLLSIYPVGAIYISTVSTSPASLFGGTWEQLSGQFLLASSSTYTAGSSGGSETVTLTVDQMPSHQHKPLYMDRTSYKLRNRGNFGGGSYSSAVTTEGTSNNNIFTANTGGGKAHNNMPPYLAVYMWKRTA